MGDLFTVKQVQDLLKVDRITVYRMLQDGRLKGIKVGHQWRFNQSEVQRFFGIVTEEPSIRIRFFKQPSHTLHPNHSKSIFRYQPNVRSGSGYAG